MTTLKQKSHSNYYKKLYQRWRQIDGTHALAEIANLALDMLVDELFYERAVVFVHEDATGLFKALHHRGYTDAADLQMLRIVQALLSGEVVEAMRQSQEPLVHTQELPVLAAQALLKQLRLQEAVLCVFGGDAEVPFGFVVVGNHDANSAKQPVQDSTALVALNNLMVHLSHAVNSATFYQAWAQEKARLNSNIALRTQEILAQKQQFEAIFQNSKDGIAVLDVHTTAFLDANPAFLELTGFTREELMRRSCMAITAPENLSASQKAFEQVIKEGHVVDFMKNCVVAGGKRATVNMSMALMHNSSIFW